MEPQSGLIVNEDTEMVNIYCTFSSNPPELTQNATWFKDGLELMVHNDSHYISHFSGYPILTILNPNRTDSGVYWCSVANEVGEGVPDKGARINVLFPTPEPIETTTTLSPDIIKEGNHNNLI